MVWGQFLQWCHLMSLEGSCIHSWAPGSKRPEHSSSRTLLGLALAWFSLEYCVPLLRRLGWISGREDCRWLCLPRGFFPPQVTHLYSTCSSNWSPFGLSATFAQEELQSHLRALTQSRDHSVAFCWVIFTRLRSPIFFFQYHWLLFPPKPFIF